MACTSSWGPGLLLAPVRLQKPRIWNWVFLSKSIFLNVPRASQVMLWWPMVFWRGEADGWVPWGGCTPPFAYRSQLLGSMASVFSCCCSFTVEFSERYSWAVGLPEPLSDVFVLLKSAPVPVAFSGTFTGAASRAFWASPLPPLARMPWRGPHPFALRRRLCLRLETLVSGSCSP